MNLFDPDAAVNHEPRPVRLHHGTGGVECRADLRQAARCRIVRAAVDALRRGHPRPHDWLALIDGIWHCEF
jgi:hypothetical protein